MIVITNADAKCAKAARTPHTFQAILTLLLSCLSGQKRSKKKSAPKMNATKTPAKMLYEAAPT